MIHLTKELKIIAKQKCLQIINIIENNTQTTATLIIQKAWKEIKKLETRILRAFPFEHHQLEQFICTTITEFLELEERRVEREFRPTNVLFDKSAVVNLTDIDIPADILLAASFGPKFCFKTDDTCVSTALFLSDTILHLENNCPVETYNEIYKQISIELSKEVTKEIITADVWTEFLKYRIRTFQTNHRDILITRSDKGKHAVFLYKNVYEQKMSQLILHNSDYEEIPNIDIESLQNKNNEFVNQLTNSGAIPPNDKHRFIDSCCIESQMYGLLKIHKDNLPARPITASYTSPGFKLSKFITQILSNVFHEQGYHVLRSSDIIDKLNILKIKPDEAFVSFDVVSMFTNIPIELMLQILSEKANIFKHNHNIDFSLLKEILRFLLKECAVFSWNGRTFKQVDSLAMGSPLSPILAKILMNNILAKIIPNLVTPKFIALYVDDSLWLLKKNEINKVLSGLNNYHHRIKFTHEIETNNSISFLDITIIRLGDEIVTNWYKKPFASSRLLNFYSLHESSCIIQTAIAYVEMIKKLSHPMYFLENKDMVENILRLNSFPETIIMNIMHKHYTLMHPPQIKEKFMGNYVPIFHRGTLTGRLKKQVGPFLDGGRLVGIPDRSGTHTFSRVKDKINPAKKTNIIIFLSCFCARKLVMKHTEYLKRADQVIINLQSQHNINKKGKCGIKHKFGKFQFLQIKNYSLMRKMFDMIAYANRSRLSHTKFSIPIFKFTKHLNTTKTNVQEQISKIHLRN